MQVDITHCTTVHSNIRAKLNLFFQMWGRQEMWAGTKQDHFRVRLPIFSYWDFSMNALPKLSTCAGDSGHQSGDPFNVTSNNMLGLKVDTWYFFHIFSQAVAIVFPRPYSPQACVKPALCSLIMPALLHDLSTAATSPANHLSKIISHQISSCILSRQACEPRYTHQLMCFDHCSDCWCRPQAMRDQSYCWPDLITLHCLIFSTEGKPHPYCPTSYWFLFLDMRFKCNTSYMRNILHVTP